MRADIIRQRLEQGIIARLGLTLLYGLPGSGKTQFTAKGISSPLIDRVFLFSFDRGYETILFARDSKGERILSDSDLAKIEIITTREGEEEANAGPLVRWIFSNPNWKGVISPTGKRASQRVAEDDVEWPGLNKLGHRDLIILDTITIVGHSIHKHNELHSGLKTKGGKDDTQRIYGVDAVQQRGLLSSMQGHDVHICCIAQAILPDIESDRHFDKIYPEFGSKNFSVQTSSYFGNVVYLHVDTKFRAGSSPLYKPKVIARSRHGVAVEKLTEPTLADLIQAREQGGAN